MERQRSADDPSLFAFLPSDVLRLVIELTSERARLTVIALVCKRWLEAVYRTITYLRKEMSMALLSRLPLVTAIDVTYARLGNLPPPSSFPHLRAAYLDHEDEACCCTALLMLPPLGTLRLRVIEHCGGSLGEYLAPHLTSLTHLEINPSYESIYLPRLRSFRLLPTYYSAPAAEARIIALHATQLECLSIKQGSPTQARVLNRLRFPLLRELELKWPSTEGIDFVAHSPALQRFELHVDACNAYLFPLLLPHMTALTVHPGVHFGAELLRAATRLTSLRAIGQSVARLQDLLLQLPMFGAGLRKLQIGGIAKSHTDVTSIVARCTLLEKLALSEVHLSRANVILPHLRVLHYAVQPGWWYVPVEEQASNAEDQEKQRIHAASVAEDKVIEMLAIVPFIAPHLKCMKLTMRGTSRSVVERLGTSLKALDRAGVEEFVIFDDVLVTVTTAVQMQLQAGLCCLHLDVRR